MKPQSRPSYPRYRAWMPPFFLLIVTLCAYQPAWDGGMIFDDTGNITSPGLSTVEGLGRIWTEPGATMQYYPLLYSVFWIMFQLFGTFTVPYHLLAILLHVFAAFLLALLLKRLGMSKVAWPAAWIFALHPVMVESVAWMTQLKNTLSGVFFLGAALAYVAYGDGGKRRPYVLALVLFVCGLLSKTAIVTFPLAMLAVIWWKRGRLTWKREIVPLLPFFLVAFFSGIFTVYVEHSFVGLSNIKNELGFSFLERVLLAGRIFWFYLGKIFWPSELLFFYPRWEVSTGLWWQYLYPLTAIALGVALWKMRKRWRAPFSVYCYYAVMLFPVIGFLNVYFFRYSFVADHFLYYAAIGPIVLTAGLAEKGLDLLTLGTQRIFRPVAYGFLFLVLSVVTWNQSRLYDNAEILYREVIKKNPASWISYNNLGVILSQTGRQSEAMDILRQGLKIKTDFAEIHNNIGLLLLKTEQAGEAIASFKKALEIDPKYNEASKNLGIANDVAISKKVAEELQKNPNPKEAIAVLEKALTEAESRGRGELAVRIRSALERFSRAGASDAGTSKQQER